MTKIDIENLLMTGADAERIESSSLSNRNKSAILWRIF
jgi:hypothetical protein